MSTFKGRGIVLKQISVGESDKIVTLLLKDIGKVTVFARGARRQKSEFLASTEIFTYADFVINKGKKYLAFSEIDIIESFYSIRTNFEKLCYGYYFLEIIDKIVLEDMPCNDILLLLIKTLQELRKENVDVILVANIFNIKFLEYNGYYKKIDFCSSCGLELTENSFYSCDGVICSNCKNKYEHSTSISNDTIFTINYIITSNTSSLFNFKVGSKVVNELNIIGKDLIREHLSLNLKSLKMLD